MNKARILQLADYIEAHPEQTFNMANIDTCFIGFGGRLFFGDTIHYDSFRLGNFLGLTWGQMDALFFPTSLSDTPTNFYRRGISRELAVGALRHVAKVGYISSENIP